MNKILSATLATIATIFSASALSAPGEYWEVTSKMEMEGMPFAMPGMTQKVCVPKGSENDPSKTTGDKDCKMSDIKTSGNRTTWKARCDRDGEVMVGVGEQTTSAKGYEGKMQFSGKSDGEDVNMKMSYSGKRIGGSCDTEEMIKKAKSQACDKSQYDTTSAWISGADTILGKNAMCAEQRTQLCDKVRKDTPKDADAYNALLMHDQRLSTGVSVAKECKVDMAATTKAICKTLNGKNYDQLAKHCPSEAKTYREVQRRKDCAGRSYTAETRAADIKKCMSGQSDSSNDDDEEPAPSKPAKLGKPSSDTSAQEMLESAKKLKGMFSF
ncbi:MAG: DUF3617 family protein [Sideroxydans sp.]|jgi:hypothetical protein